MQVILIEPVENLGSVGDVVKVKNGYARNYLMPKGKVLLATKENQIQFEARRAEIEKENASKRAAAQKESVKVEGKFILIVRQAGEDGRLFGSVNSRDIAEKIVSDLGVTVQKSQIALDKPIKSLGVFSERVVLHPEVSIRVNVNVARSEEEAEEQKQAFLNPKVKKKDGEQEEVSAEAKEEISAEDGEEAAPKKKAKKADAEDDLEAPKKKAKKSKKDSE